jgi:monoterpene epsilon-lactone hydrolase
VHRCVPSGLQMRGRVQFSGPAQYRAKTAALLCRAAADVCLRRLFKGPRCAAWNLAAELGTEIARRQLLAAFEMPDLNQARIYLDSIAIQSSALSNVITSNNSLENFKGSWFIPSDIDPDMMMLYLHGGGYSFYPRPFYSNLAAMIALSAKTKVFALDYSLSPEHKFPVQLTEALDAYRWLLNMGVESRHLVVTGDSAGGNLTLALLLSLRDLRLPLPALAICLSPATDFEGSGAGAPATSELDWITQEMAVKWAEWYCPPEQRRHPLVSPLNANLKGLPPIYIQAGGAEILLPSIQMFVERAQEQGADVVLETWPGMNHDFQMFGYEVPQSAEAIKRIGEVIASRIPRKKQQPVLFDP